MNDNLFDSSSSFEERNMKFIMHQSGGAFHSIESHFSLGDLFHCRDSIDEVSIYDDVTMSMQDDDSFLSEGFELLGEESDWFVKVVPEDDDDVKEQPPLFVRSTPSEPAKRTVSTGSSDTTATSHRTKKKREFSYQHPRKTLPQRPLSSFNLFFRDERRRILDRLSKAKKSKRNTCIESIPLQDLVKTIERRWQSLSSSDRTKYEMLSREDADRYRSEMKSFNETAQKTASANGAKHTNKKKHGSRSIHQGQSGQSMRKRSIHQGQSGQSMRKRPKLVTNRSRNAPSPEIKSSSVLVKSRSDRRENILPLRKSSSLGHPIPITPCRESQQQDEIESKVFRRKQSKSRSNHSLMLPDIDIVTPFTNHPIENTNLSLIQKDTSTTDTKFPLSHMSYKAGNSMNDGRTKYETKRDQVDSNQQEISDAYYDCRQISLPVDRSTDDIPLIPHHRVSDASSTGDDPDHSTSRVDSRDQNGMNFDRTSQSPRSGSVSSCTHRNDDDDDQDQQNCYGIDSPTEVLYTPIVDWQLARMVLPNNAKEVCAHGIHHIDPIPHGRWQNYKLQADLHYGHSYQQYHIEYKHYVMKRKDATKFITNLRQYYIDPNHTQPHHPSYMTSAAPIYTNQHYYYA